MKFLRESWERRRLLILAGLLLSVWAGLWLGLVAWPAALLAQSLLFFLFHGWSVAGRYRRLEQLSREVTRVLQGESSLAIAEYAEGEFSILRSEIHKMSQRLIEQKERLQADKISLAESLADISHQIRTPLTSLSLITDRLRETGTDQALRSRLLREQLAHLRQIDWLITALLKISKLDAGTAVLQTDKVTLQQWVGRSLEPLMIPLELKEIRVQTDLADGAAFYGDSAWSAEALTNILKNCMEHTPLGGRMSLHGLENPLYTELIVEDTGPGIDPKDLPHLFERFYKGRNSSDQSIGIGLALARLIVSRQGGTIKVENRKEGGARFILRFYKNSETHGSTPEIPWLDA